MGRQPPMLLPRILVALHVLSLMLWIGSLVSITRVLSSAVGGLEAARPQLASTARRIYRVVASPWMGVAVLSGIGLLAYGLTHGNNYFRQGWFHVKLTAVVVLLALHFVLGARVRHAESKGLTDDVANGVRLVQLGTLVAATLAVACVTVWQFVR